MLAVWEGLKWQALAGKGKDVVDCTPACLYGTTLGKPGLPSVVGIRWECQFQHIPPRKCRAQ